MAHISDDWYSTLRPGKRSVEKLDTEAIACCVVGVDCRQYGRSRFRFRGSKEFGDCLSEGNLSEAILGSGSTDSSQSQYSTLKRCEGERLARVLVRHIPYGQTTRIARTWWSKAVGRELVFA